MNQIYDKKTGEFGPSTGTDDRNDVSSRTASRWFYLSRDKGSLYSWPIKSSAKAGEIVFYFENTSDTEKFYIKDIHFESDVNCDFELCWIEKARVDDVVIGTTGDSVNGVTWNKSVPHTLKSEVKKAGASSVTGLDNGKSILNFDTIAKITSVESFDGALVAGKGEILAIKTDVDAEVHITLVGAFE